MTDNRKARLRHILDQPFIGFTPWILLSVVEGPGRVVLAGVLACALALALAGAGLIADTRPKLLDMTGIVFFGVMIVVAATGGASTRHWLGLWAGEASNLAIALITLGSITARRPFTLAYARETTERAYWDSPLFLRINYVISAVWAIAFILTAVTGYIGDGPLHQPNNIWTAWIIQIALVILAIKFTAWYPDHATAEPRTAEPRAAEPRADGQTHAKRNPHPLELLRPLAAYLVPAGIVVLIVSNTWWIGAVLIVAGVLLSRWLRRHRAIANPPQHHPT
jgi:hypothetical protein